MLVEHRGLHLSAGLQLLELSGGPVSVLEEVRRVSLVEQVPVLLSFIFQLPQSEAGRRSRGAAESVPRLGGGALVPSGEPRGQLAVGPHVLLRMRSFTLTGKTTPL